MRADLRANRDRVERGGPPTLAEMVSDQLNLDLPAKFQAEEVEGLRRPFSVPLPKLAILVASAQGTSETMRTLASPCF